MHPGIKLKNEIRRALDTLTIDSIDCNGVFYNYKLKKYESLDGPINNEKAMQYIPQGRAVQEMYLAHRQLGKNEFESIIAVLNFITKEYQAKENP